MRASILAAITLLCLLSTRAVFAGSCSSNVSTTGNWNVAASWSAGCTGAGGIPSAADNVTISSGDTVNVTANAAAASVTMAGGSATGVFLVINSSVTLTVGGNVTYTASTSTNRTRRITLQTGAQLIINGNLAMNSGAVTGSITDLTIANSASSLVDVNGSITFSGTVAPSITFSGAGTLNVTGDFGNGGALSAGTGTVNYDGSGAQNLGNYTYNVLTISKAGIRTIRSAGSAAR